MQMNVYINRTQRMLLHYADLKNKDSCGISYYIHWNIDSQLSSITMTPSPYA